MVLVRRVPLAGALGVLALACDPARAADGEPAQRADPLPPAPAGGAPTTTPPPPATPVSPGDPAESPAPTPSPACPPDMVLAAGSFCPEVEQRCLEQHPEVLESERCLRFESPSRCLAERVDLRVCVDRFEWPNRAGERPRVLVSYGDAAAACASAGKRLCEEREWLFACEGEAMLPYVNGFERDPTACVVDRLYVERRGLMLRWDRCQASDECRSELGRVDQREPAGTFSRCVSPFGAHDMNGNVNEWVTIAGERFPNRSGLKGGWWGPVRNRCRPTVRFHKEEDWGYEIGFRCCQDAAPKQ